METLKFCLIGAGRAGMVHAKNIVYNIKNSELVGIVDPDEKNLQVSGNKLDVKNRFSNVEDALSWGKFDAVVIVTPTFLHRDIAVKCAEAGKHIFCEKPMAITVKEAEEMIESARRNKVKLQIGFMRRFDPPFLRAFELIRDGKFGEVMMIKSVGRGPGLPPPWTYDISRSNGMLGEVNSHDFDSTRWLAGSEYKRVYAEAVNRKVGELRDDYPDFYDNAICIFRFKNDVIGTIDGTCPAGYGYDARTEILLTKGLIQIGDISEKTVLTCDIDGKVETDAFKSWRNRFREAYIEEIKSFIRSIIDDKEPAVTGQDGLSAVRAVIAANKSIKTGVPVELD